jgi:NADH dehydrogenase FAD-containing subunit
MATSTPTANQRTILILGGSYGGTGVAHSTLKHIIPKLPSPETYTVVLVSSSREIIVRPAFPRALISDCFFDQGKLWTDLESGFKQYGERFKFIHGIATGFDTEARVVTVSPKDGGEGGELKIEYHALVIATGSSTPSPLLSLNSGGRDELKTHWSAFRTALPTAKSIIIAGGGPVGIETAGELGEYLNGRAGFFASKLADPKVKITVISKDAEILPVMRPALAQAAEGYLAKVGVEVVTGVSVESVSPAEAGRQRGEVTAKTEVTLSDGKTLQADLYIPAYGTVPNTGFVPEVLRAKDGRVETNPETLRVDKAGERVYAVGDASNYARPAVHIIMDAVPVLAANLKRDLLIAAGQTPPGDDRLLTADEGETQLVPIGRSKGVGAFKGTKLPSFLVWLFKGRDYFVGMTGGMWSGQNWAKEI